MAHYPQKWPYSSFDNDTGQIYGQFTSPIDKTFGISLTLTTGDGVTLWNLGFVWTALFTCLMDRRLPSVKTTIAVCLTLLGIILIQKPQFLFGNGWVICEAKTFKIGRESRPPEATIPSVP